MHDGVTLSLPAATSYVHASTGDNQTRRWRADGAGSTLDLSNLRTISGGTHFNSDLRIDAAEGGQIDLGQVDQILDPNSGDLRRRAVEVRADGAGSTIDLTSLTFVEDRDTVKRSGYNDGDYSVLSATDGATLSIPNATNLHGVSLVLDGSATLPATI